MLRLATAGGFDLGTEWAWQDGAGDATENSGVEQAVGMPLFDARGDGLTFTADIAAVTSASTDAPSANPADFDPRAAAFADMRMMAAAASMPKGVAEAGTFGGGRRRR